MGDNGNPTIENIGQFTFLNCVLKETLRLHPAIASAGLREAKKDVVLANHFIPKGTLAVLPMIRAHYSPEYWENPTQFMPQRWMDERNDKNLNQILSFSSGIATFLLEYGWMESKFVSIVSVCVLCYV
eukprot:TRINITY_DN1473_c0_g1_i3.p1 TRINITY_DN1473_c0_g1~~TRINITY_DN1473_c0_g1_i3.p1  ORF type:complete len:128 (-),score=25.41 TRINITY_DN1473_c0_g1_i3:47-430(-)